MAILYSRDDDFASHRYPHRDTHCLVHQLVAVFGADRCLWGSNFTGADHTASEYTYEDAFQLMYSHVGLSEEDRGWVMGGTAEKLFRWAGVARTRLEDGVANVLLPGPGSSMEPLPPELELTAHLTNLEYQGFVSPQSQHYNPAPFLTDCVPCNR